MHALVCLVGCVVGAKPKVVTHTFSTGGTLLVTMVTRTLVSVCVAQGASCVPVCVLQRLYVPLLTERAFICWCWAQCVLILLSRGCVWIEQTVENKHKRVH